MHSRSAIRLFPKCRNNDNCARTGIDEIEQVSNYAGTILFRSDQYLGGNEQPKTTRQEHFAYALNPYIHLHE
jgi:hypothetical protein